jgi:hypothetical protein
MVRTRIKGNGMKAAASPSTEPDFYSMDYCYDEVYKNTELVPSTEQMMKIEDDSSIEVMLQDDDDSYDEDDSVSGDGGRGRLSVRDIARRRIPSALDLASEITRFEPMERPVPKISSRISLFDEEFEGWKFLYPEEAEDFCKSMNDNIFPDPSTSLTLASIFSTPTPAACFDCTNNCNEISKHLPSYYSSDYDSYMNKLTEGDDAFEGPRFCWLPQELPPVPAWEDPGLNAFQI